MFCKALLYGLALLPLGILAALDDKTKLANKTIDRVSCCTLGGGWPEGQVYASDATFSTLDHNIGEAVCGTENIC